MKNPHNELTPFQKGIDFIQHFSDKKFTLDDIKDRYHCTYRQAVNLRNQSGSLLDIAPAGLSNDGGHRGCLRNLWEIHP